MKRRLEGDVVSPRLHILERLVEGPPILLHQVRCEDSNAPALPSQRVDEDTLSFIQGLVDEVGDIADHLIAQVQDDLRIVVHPGKDQVLDSNRLEGSAHLPTSAVDDPSNFVGDHKFQVLGRKFITKEQSVLQLHCSRYPLWHATC